MKSFFSTLWTYVRPYKARFFMGAILGILAGFKEPILILSVYIVFVIAFNDPNAMKGITERIDGLSESMPDLANWLNGVIQGMQDSPSLGLALMVISIIPITMFVGGAMNYLYIYCMHWVSVRAVGGVGVCQ